jgi:hypothetical protein
MFGLLDQWPNLSSAQVLAQKTLAFTFAHYVGTNSALQRPVVGLATMGKSSG